MNASTILGEPLGREGSPGIDPYTLVALEP